MTDIEIAVGHRLELVVERVAPGGHCVAHHDGRVVFVRHTLPGERVGALVTEVHPGYLRADAVEVIAAAAGRTAAPCRYAGPGGCGGCDWQHATPATQRDLKAATITELLVRIGHLGRDEVDALDVRVAELAGGPLGWRSRVRYAVDARGRVGLRAHRSHHVVPIDECLIATAAVRSLPVTGRSWPAGAEITATAAAGRGSAVTSRLPRSDRRGRPVRPARLGVSRLVDGEPELIEPALGRDFAVPVGAFWQVHPAAPDTLVSAALDLLRPRSGERAVDLYGGVGLFAAALAEAVGPTGSVLLVESDRAAVRAAEANLADLPQASTLAGRVDGRVTEVLAAADTVLLDPPRAGAGREVVTALAASGARAVCYVACDAAALARDTRQFGEAGWRLTRLRAFDAFPMTQHVECVALFQPSAAHR